jgi:hypothetical protein
MDILENIFLRKSDEETLSSRTMEHTWGTANISDKTPVKLKAAYLIHLGVCII